ncbi:MAG: AI-2E family transporter [Patescibacteria group bacterium]
MPSRQIIEISTGTLLKIIVFVLGLAALYIVREILLILLLSIVIASAINPAIRRLQSYRFPRPLAVLALYVLTAALFAFVFYLLVPPLVGELRNFATTFTALLENTLMQVRERLSSFYSYAPEFVSMPAESLTDKLNKFINNNFFTVFSASSSVGSSLFGGVFSFVLTVVLSFYFAVQENGISNFLKVVTPREHEQYVEDLWTRSQQKIGKWLQGQLLLGVLVGVLVYLGLTLLGVRYALILALLAAVFELIPLFGPILAAIPGVLLAFLQGPILAVWVVLLYVIVQQMENHLIYPLVVRRAVGVPPLVVIISLLVGGKLAGFIGLVLAVPVASALLEYVNDVVKQKTIFDNNHE